MRIFIIIFSALLMQGCFYRYSGISLINKSESVYPGSQIALAPIGSDGKILDIYGRSDNAFRGNRLKDNDVIYLQYEKNAYRPYPDAKFKPKEKCDLLEPTAAMCLALSSGPDHLAWIDVYGEDDPLKFSEVRFEAFDEHMIVEIRTTDRSSQGMKYEYFLAKRNGRILDIYAAEIGTNRAKGDTEILTVLGFDKKIDDKQDLISTFEFLLEDEWFLHQGRYKMFNMESDRRELANLLSRK